MIKHVYNTLLCFCLLALLPLAGLSQTILKVGASQQYSSITAAYAAIPNNFSGPYVIELHTGYSSLNETFPLTFGYKAGSSATNTITVRSVVNGLIIASADIEATVIVDSCSYLTIEGDTTGLAENQNLTILNTNVLGCALLVRRSAQNFTVRYANLRAITVVTNNTRKGVVTIKPTDHYDITGCTISNNNITGANVNFPSAGIYTEGGDINGLHLAENNIYDCIRFGAVFSTVANATIYSNSFFHKYYWKLPRVCVEANSSSNTNLIVKSNFIGGTQPKCGGAKAMAQCGAVFSLSANGNNPGSVDSTVLRNFDFNDTIVTANNDSFWTVMELIGVWRVGFNQPNYFGDTSLTNAIDMRVYNTSSGSTGTLYASLIAQRFNPQPTTKIMVENAVIGGIEIVPNSNSNNTSAHLQLFRDVSTVRNCRIGSSQQVNIRNVVPAADGGKYRLRFAVAANADTVENCKVSGIYVRNAANIWLFEGSETYRNKVSNINIGANTLGANTGYVFYTSTADTAENISIHNFNQFAFSFFGLASGSIVRNVNATYSAGSAPYTTSSYFSVFYRGAKNCIVENIALSDSNTFDFNKLIITGGACDNNIIRNISALGTVTAASSAANVQVYNNRISNITARNILGIQANTAINNIVEYSNNIVSDLYGKNAVTGMSLTIGKTLRVHNNSISNISAIDTVSPNAHILYGINITGFSPSDSLFVSNNTVKNLTYNTGTTTNSAQNHVSGISVTCGGIADSISRNIVQNIQVMPRSTTGGLIVSGIMCSTGFNVVPINNNRVSHIWIDTNVTTARVYGIYAAQNMVFNNLVQLGVNANGIATNANVYMRGIYAIGDVDTKVYFNTVYLAGNNPGGTRNSAALYIDGTQKTVLNNILINNRSTMGGGNGKNFAFGTSGVINTTLDNNVYYAPGTNGFIATVDTGVTGINSIPAFQTAMIGQNLNSINADPILANPAGDTASLDLAPPITSSAVGAGIMALINTTNDYFYNTRNNPPSIGAIEYSGQPVFAGTVNACGGANGSVTYNIGNNLVWDTVKVFNAQNQLVQTYTNVSDSIKITPLANGNYTIRFIHASGVTSSYTVTINNTTAPQAPSAVSTTICNGGSTTVLATGSNNYQWYDSATGGNLISSQASYTTPVLNDTATYYVQTTTGSCSSTRTVVKVNTVTLNTPVISVQGQACLGTGAVLTTNAIAGVSVRWYNVPTGGAAISASANYSTPALSGNATYYAEFVAGTCTSGRASIALQPIAGPAAPTLVQSPVDICTGGSATISVNNTGLTYTWYTSPTATAAIATGASYTTPALTAATTTYYVQASDGTCPSNRVSVQVIATQLPAPVIPNQVICGNASVTLTSSAAGTYWYTSQNSLSPVQVGSSYTTPILFETTTYYAEVISATCTSQRVPVVITYAAAAIPTITSNGVTLTSSIAASYQWQLNGTDIDEATQRDYIPTESGTYTVVITNNNACQATSAPYSFTIIGINEVADLFIGLYPNPASNSIVAALKGNTSDVYLSIINNMGQVVHQQHIAANIQTIDISQLAQGVYIWNAHIEGKEQRGRLIICR